MQLTRVTVKSKMTDHISAALHVKRPEYANCCSPSVFHVFFLNFRGSLGPRVGQLCKQLFQSRPCFSFTLPHLFKQSKLLGAVVITILREIVTSERVFTT